MEEQDRKFMEDLDNKLNLILSKLDNEIIPAAKKMDTHINFIERVYNYVKIPLIFIANKIHAIANVRSMYSVQNQISALEYSE